MHHALHIHPDCICAAVRSIDVQLTRRVGELVLQYTIRGATAELNIADLAASRRADNLWQHTCCEAFIGFDGNDAYYEFNFSPSTEWAVYGFDAYRAGMKVANDIAPKIQVRRRDDRLELRAAIDAGEIKNRDVWRVGLSAVIEQTDGRKSYWALAHPLGKPDFHRADCFTLLLPPHSQV